MAKAAMITDQREPSSGLGHGTPAGVKGGIIAVGRGLALTGLAFVALGLLLTLLLGMFLVALGFGVATHGSLPGLQRPALMAALLLGGLVLTRILTVPVLLGIRQLARLARQSAGQWAGRPIAEAYQPPPRSGPLSFRDRLRWLAADPATWRDLAWALISPVYSALTAALPAIMIAIGLLWAGRGLQRHSSAMSFASAIPASTGRVVKMASHSYGYGAAAPLQVLGGLAVVGLGVALAPWLLRGYASFTNTLLAPTGQAELTQRVYHLTQTRTETIDSGAAEIRRIERDLHDGAQARLVAVGMTLGAAEDLIDTSPAAARALLTEARAASVLALAELRALVRGIHPPVLADRGLADAIRALALDSGLRVEVVTDLPGRPQPPVESAAYFAVSELLANVSKHAGTRQAWIDLRYDQGALRVDVTDNGQGGADPVGGTGLRGIERRVAAFDGILALNSPVGGPTVVTMEIPCALSLPKISSC
jgi:signal transduction histidine kinase